MLLEPEQLFLANFFGMLQEVQQSVNDELSAILLCHFTTESTAMCSPNIIAQPDNINL